MKRSALCLLLSLTMIISFAMPALAAAPTDPAAQNQEEAKPEEEVRDQDMLVPTGHGVQRATKKEFDEIKELEKLPNAALVKNYLIGDFESGEILMASNIDEPVGIASVTKLMTVYIALDEVAAGRLHWEDVVVPDEECLRLTGASYKLKEGETYTVRQLLTAALVISGNDATMALAKHIGGSQDAFVARMNEKARELGLTHAHFINVHGLTDYTINDYNKMTPRELFILSIHLLQDHREILEFTTIPYISEIERPFLGYNTNPLLGIVKGVDGLKTGYTGAAGHCLVATGFTPGEGNYKDTRLIGIFMGSDNSMKRFVGSKRLMEDGMARFRYTKIADPEEPVKIVKLKKGVPDEIEIYPKEGTTLILDNKQALNKEVVLDPIKVPTKKGSVVGTVVYSVGDQVIYKTPAVIHESIKEPNVIIQFQRTLEDAFLKMREAI